MKRKPLFAGLLIAASAGLAVLAYCILPEIVVIQFSAGSSGNSTAPKLFAILIPTVLGIGGAVASLFAKNERAFGKRLLASAVGIALAIFTIVVNTRIV